MDYLKNQGVDFPVNHSKENYVTQVFKYSNGQKIDVAFNSVGGSTFKNDNQRLSLTNTLYSLLELLFIFLSLFKKIFSYSKK